MAHGRVILVLVLAWGLTPLSASPAQERAPAGSHKDNAPSITEIEAALKREPGNPKLYVQLGLACWERKDYPHAVEAFQQAVKVGPNFAEGHNWLGVARMGRGDLPGAIDELRKAVALDPRYARAFTNLGSALAKSGELSEAVEMFQKALALEPNSLTAHLNLGIALRENGQAKAALVHLRRVAHAEPRNAAIHCEFAKTLDQSGDVAGAVAEFDHALRIDPGVPQAYYGLGLALKQLSGATHKPASPSPSTADEFYKRAQEAADRGDFSAAKEQLSQALRADENHANSQNLLGYVLGQEGDLASARVHLERAVALRPDIADFHYNLGAALWYSGSKSKAISELEQSVRLDPAAGGSYALLGLAQRETGDLAGARANLERAMAILPPTTATYVDLGIVLLRQDELEEGLQQMAAGLSVASGSLPAPDWDEAIAELRRLLAKKTNRPDVHNMIGLLLGAKGADSSEVLAELREAVREHPDYAEAHNNIGLVLAQNGDDEKAVAEFREAIRIQPDYADAHSNLGAALLLTDVEQAITELEKAVALDPTLVKARFNLAEAYGSGPSGGAAKQIEQLNKVISIAPTFARAHLALGKALLHEGKIDEAAGELQEAVRLNPQSGEAHYQLGLAMARAGKQQEASAEVKKGRELSAADERNQNANLDISEGRSAFAKGELEEAAEKFRHAVKLDPDSSIAQRYLGVVLEKQGDTAAALAAYQKALELNPGDLAARQSVNKLTPPDDGPHPQRSPNAEEDDPGRIAELEAYIRQSRFPEVEPLLADYVKAHANSSWGWYALGYSQFAQKQIGESIKSLSHSLALNARNADAHKILGRDLMIIGRFNSAQTEFEQGIRDDPASAENHYDLGKLFSLQDNWEAARKEFEEAVRIDPAYLEAIDALGFAQEALADNGGAVQSYEKAIALNQERHGNFVGAHVNLSAYYNRTGSPAKALEYAQKALDLDPKADAAWFQKAKAEEGQGQLQEAVDSLTRAVSLNPRSSTYYYVLAGVDRRLGKTEDSQKALDSFSRLERENNELQKMRRTMSKTAAAPHP